MTAYRTENRCWRILKQIPKKNSTFPNAHPMEGITGCSVTQDIVGVFTRTLENLFLVPLPKIVNRTVLQFPHRADQ